MSSRTNNLQVFPWVGALNTANDETLIEFGELTEADNITFDYNDAKKRREGINYNWDNAVFTVTSRSSAGTSRTLTGTFTNTGLVVGDTLTVSGSSNALYNADNAPITAISGTGITYTATGSLTESATADVGIVWSNIVVGGIDYWVGTEDAKTQFIISVLDNGAVYRTVNGARTRIPDAGTPWTTPLTEANLEVYQNRVVTAVSGLTNKVKFWDGNPANSLQDLYANAVNGGFDLLSTQRSSVGTTRTLTFAAAVPFANGTEVYINGGPAAYNGRYTIVTGGNTPTITYVAATPLTEATTADVTLTIGIAAPLALFLREHIGCLWMNDKTRLDRLHYSGINNPFQWGGVGTSGAVDVGVGDGDPQGLTGIAPTFKGDLFVGKRTKLYRIVGLDPDTASISKVSTGIGFLSHQGIVGIDQDDLFFVSDRGFHSMNATNAYGDFQAGYISTKIQNRFVENFEEGRKRYIKAAYLPQINSAVFAVSEDGSATNNSLYLFNIPKKYWYRWPNVQAESLISVQDSDRRRVYLGTYRGRLAQTLTQTNVDRGFDNTVSNINSRVSTGLIFVDHRADTIKAFKRIRLIYRGSGSFIITASIKIDNFAEQAVSFSSSIQGVPLGQFVLGEDVLGSSYVTAPYSMGIDGYGRGIKITVTQNDLNTLLAIQGFIIEYEGGGDSPETRLGSNE